MYCVASLCCVCLSSDGQLVNVDKPDEDNVKFKQKLSFCHPDIVCPKVLNDICRQCTHNLRTAYDFKMRYLSSTFKLKSYVEKLSQNGRKYSNLFVELTDFAAIKEIKEENMPLRTDESEEILTEPTLVEDCEMDRLNIKKENEPLRTESEVTATGLSTDRVGEEMLNCPASTDLGMVGDITSTEIINISTELPVNNSNLSLTTGEISDNKEDRMTLPAHEICNNNTTKQVVLSNIKQESDTIVKEEPDLLALDVDKENSIVKSSEPVINTVFIKVEPNDSHSESFDEKSKEADDELSNNDNSKDGKKKYIRKRKYSCSVCQKWFHYPSGLKLHLRIHDGYKPFSCSVCSKQFSQNGSLRRHMFTHNGKKQHPCNICNKNYTEKSSLKKHLKSHVGEHLVSCKICNKEVNDKHLYKHEKEHTRVKLYGCDSCNAKFFSTHLLDLHKILHTNTSSKFICSVCNKQYFDIGSLNRHKLTHTTNRPYACKVCSKRFNSVSGLDYHIKTHKGENIVTCKICGKKCSYKSLKRHEEMVHNSAQSHICDICGENFSNVYALKYHRILHADKASDNVCSICNKQLSTKSSLERHKLTHTGDKPYICNICDKHFAEKGSLKYHLTTHEGEPLVTCKICNEGVSPKNIKQHIQNHAYDDPIVCTSCDASFASVVALNEHKCTRTEKENG